MRRTKRADREEAIASGAVPAARDSSGHLPREGSLEPTGNADRVMARLRALQRDPFLEILANFIQAQPSLHQLRRFAEDHPDKWASALANIARLAGYADKSEIEANVFVHIAQMGDAQLLQRMQELDAQLNAAGEYEVDAQPQEI